MGGLGGEGEGAELPQPQPQPHGGRDPPRFCDPYRRSGLLPLWGSRIGGVQVTIFDRGLQRNVILGVRGLGAEGLARSRGFRATSRGLSCYRHFCCPPRGWGLSCYQPGAFVLPHCTGLPRGKKCPEQMEALLRQAVDEASTSKRASSKASTGQHGNSPGNPPIPVSPELRVYATTIWRYSLRQAFDKQARKKAHHIALFGPRALAAWHFGR